MVHARDGGDAPIHQPLQGVRGVLQVVVVVLVAWDATSWALVVQILGNLFEDKGGLGFES